MKSDMVNATRFGAKTRLALLASVLSMAGTAPAFAQDSGGEIVVTALKRDTRLQDTPLAISAVTGDSLERSGSTSFTQLTSETPSLRIVDGGPGNRRVILRGVVGAGEPTVGVYYDDSPVSGSVGTTSDAGGSTPDFRMFDVERAEVLRGPQGTLYGSGSMGGTMRIIYNKPDATNVEAAGQVNLTTVKGGSQGATFDGMINLPIVNDVLALRVVGGFQQFAGYVDREVNYAGISRTEKDINDGDSYGARALLRFTPNDKLTVDLAAHYSKVGTDSARWFAESDKKYVSSSRSEDGNYDENRIFAATLNYDFGPVVMTAVSTYFKRDRVVVNDVSDNFNGRDTVSGCGRYLLGNVNLSCDADQLDGYLSMTRAIQFSSLYQPQGVKNWTNELRFSSTGNGPFNWTVGAFLEDRKTSVRSTLLTADPTSGKLNDFVADNIYYDRTINDDLKQKALFAEASYKLFDKLTATYGVRWYEYDKTVGGIVEQGQIHYASVPSPYVQTDTNENGFVHKFNLSYEFSRDLMIYGQAAQGFRPGGVNQANGLPAAQAAYKSDSIWNYEFGVKSQPVRGVYVNLTGYQIDWSDMQVSARLAGDAGVFGLIANVGQARVRGVEAELTARPIQGMSIGTNIGFTEAKLTETPVVGNISVSGAVKGDRLPNVPRWNLNANAEYMWALSDTLEGLVRLDASYVGSSYSTLSTIDQFRRQTPSYTLVNARIGVQSPDGDWNVHLYVNNLFDELAVMSRSSSGNQGGLTNTFTAPPRTFGIALTKRFQ